jgi:tripartite-type tricarboxylate transporter receptor subunit TctC
VTGKTRSPALPEIPTVDESGIKHADVDLRFWFAVFGPQGLPQPILARLQKAIQTALQEPELKKRLESLDITPEFAPGADLQKLVVRDIKNWTVFIQSKGLKGQ